MSVNVHVCRQRVCCGIIYKGRFGEVLIDPHLYKPCCQKKEEQRREEEEEQDEDDAELEKEEGQASQDMPVSPLTRPDSPPLPLKADEEEEEEW